MQLFFFFSFHLDLFLQRFSVSEFVVKSDSREQNQDSTAPSDEVPHNQHKNFVDVLDEIDQVDEDQKDKVHTLVDQKGDGVNSQGLFVRVNHEQGNDVNYLKEQNEH